MAKTKGVAFLGVRAFVVERAGEDGWAAVRQRVNPGSHELLDSVVAVGWYDLALYAELLHHVTAAVGHGDAQVMRPLGRFQAERDLKTFHRVFLRFANPAYTVSKTAELWRRYHDSGAWRVERPSDTHVVATLVGHGVVDPVLCAAMGAYMQRLLELVGARGLHFAHPKCRARGEPACVYDARWD